MNQLISLILIFFCVNSSAQDQPIARLDHSGKIDLPLMEKLKYQRVNLDQITFDVLIVFDVDSSIARNERSLVELNQVNTKHANDIMQRQVAGGEFYLRRQFKSINALAATVSVQGLLNLVQDNRVVKVGLDAGGGGGLAEAIPQVSIDNVRRTYDLTGVGIEVAVLDTGIDIDHQDLQGVVLSQKCFADV
ncbi:MAG: hypothetical protein P8P22_04270, partial [Porticoccaceae bacterium]|nr:hypothetical protein [Porticoccaceae bacterium]